MAVSSRSGASGSGIGLGYQTAIGTPVAAKGSMIQKDSKIKMWPIVSNSFGLQSDVVESDVITALGADSPSEIGQFWSQGTIVIPIFINDCIDWFRGLLNPATTTNADALGVASGEIPFAAGTVITANTARTPAANKDIPKLTDTARTTGYEYAAPLKITLSAAAGTAQTFLIKGNKAAGINKSKSGNRPYHEETLTIAATGTEFTTTTHWAKIISVTPSATNAATFTGTWAPASYHLRMQLQSTDPPFLGWTTQMLKGGMPALGFDMVPGQISIAADRSSVRGSIDCFGGQYQQFRTVEGGLNDEKLTLPASDYSTVDPDGMVGWAGQLEYDGATLGYNGVDLVFNRNLDFTEVVTGDKYRSDLAATGNRQFTFSPRIPFRAGDSTSDVFNKWQDIFLADERKPLKLWMRAYGSDGRIYEMQVSAAESQLVESPLVDVTGPGPIEQSLSFKGLPGSGNSELIIDIIQKDNYTF